MTIVNDTLFFEDGLAGMAFMMEMEEENGEGNAFHRLVRIRKLKMRVLR